VRDIVGPLRDSRVPGDPNSAGLASARNLLRELHARGIVCVRGSEAAAASSLEAATTAANSLEAATLGPAAVLEAVRLRYQRAPLSGEAYHSAPMAAQRDELGVGEVERVLAVLAVALLDATVRAEPEPESAADTGENGVRAQDARDPERRGGAVTVSAGDVAHALRVLLGRMYPDEQPLSDGENEEHVDENCDYESDYGEEEGQGDDLHDGGEDVFSDASEEDPEHE
jgi:hypothetical protein